MKWHLTLNPAGSQCIPWAMYYNKTCTSIVCIDSGPFLHSSSSPQTHLGVDSDSGTAYTYGESGVGSHIDGQSSATSKTDSDLCTRRRAHSRRQGTQVELYMRYNHRRTSDGLCKSGTQPVAPRTGAPRVLPGQSWQRRLLRSPVQYVSTVVVTGTVSCGRSPLVPQPLPRPLPLRRRSSEVAVLSPKVQRSPARHVNAKLLLSTRRHWQGDREVVDGPRIFADPARTRSTPAGTD